MPNDLEARIEELERENARLHEAFDGLGALANFQKVAEFLREVFWIYDPSANTVRYVSPSYERVWGRSVVSLYEDPDGWIRAIHPEDQGRVAASFYGRAPGDNWLEEYRIVRPNGELRWISDRCVIVEESPEVVLLAGLAEDITERKRAEERAHRRETELAHVQRLGTMGEMAASIAHELNQPLSAIVTHAEVCRIALEASPGDVARPLADIEDVVTQAERAGRIIRQLRSFIRKQDPQRTETDLAGLVTEALQFVEHEARGRAVRLKVQSADTSCRVFVDRVQVQQIVLNVVRNAVDIAAELSEGTRRVVQVGTRCLGDQHAVLVRDFGPERHDDLVRKIFEPFYTTRDGGLGMGLPISRTMAEAHGGTLTAKKEPEGGLTLCLQLPHSRGER